MVNEYEEPGDVETVGRERRSYGKGESGEVHLNSAREEDNRGDRGVLSWTVIVVVGVHDDDGGSGGDGVSRRGCCMFKAHPLYLFRFRLSDLTGVTLAYHAQALYLKFFFPYLRGASFPLIHLLRFLFHGLIRQLLLPGSDPKLLRFAPNRLNVPV